MTFEEIITTFNPHQLDTKYLDTSKMFHSCQGCPMGNFVQKKLISRKSGKSWGDIDFEDKLNLIASWGAGPGPYKDIFINEIGGTSLVYENPHFEAPFLHHLKSEDITNNFYLISLQLCNKGDVEDEQSQYDYKEINTFARLSCLNNWKQQLQGILKLNQDLGYTGPVRVFMMGGNVRNTILQGNAPKKELDVSIPKSIDRTYIIEEFPGCVFMPFWSAAKTTHTNLETEQFVSSLREIYKKIEKSKDEYDYNLIDNYKDFVTFKDDFLDYFNINPESEMSFDIETAGLNYVPMLEVVEKKVKGKKIVIADEYREDLILGIGFSKAPLHGVFIPLHLKGSVIADYLKDHPDLPQFNGLNPEDFPKDDMFNFYSEDEQLLVIQGIKEILESPYKKVAHNGKFDTTYLKVQLGIEVNNFYRDTMLYAHVLDENQFKSLESFSNNYPDLKGYKGEMKSTATNEDDSGSYANVDLITLSTYTCKDVDLTLRISRDFDETNKQQNESKYAESKKAQSKWHLNNLQLLNSFYMPLQHRYAQAEMLGIRYDKEYANLVSGEYYVDIESSNEDINKILISLGVEPLDWDSLGVDGPIYKKGASQLEPGQIININSPAQMKNLLFKYYRFRPISTTDSIKTAKRNLKQEISQSEGKYQKVPQHLLDELILEYGSTDADSLKQIRDRIEEFLLLVEEKGFDAACEEPVYTDPGYGKEIICQRSIDRLFLMGDNDQYSDGIIPHIKGILTIIELILNTKKKSKMVSTYLRGKKILSRVDPNNDLHFVMKLHGTVSGRLSCMGGNTIIQTDKGLKKLIDICPIEENSQTQYHHENLKVLSHLLNYKDIEMFINKGKDEMFEVTFNDGSIKEVTMLHEFLTPKGFNTLQYIIENNLKVIQWKSLKGTHRMYKELSIINIKPLGLQTVYDISVKDDHSFITDDGIINHNSSPNVQNLPKKTANSNIRGIFTSPKDYRLFSSDLSQAELRLMADYAKDSTMLEWFDIGKDIHWAACLDLFYHSKSIIYDPKDSQMKRFRKLTKLCNFGGLYGGGDQKKVQSVNEKLEKGEEKLTLELAKAHTEWFNSTFPKIQSYLKEMEEFIKEFGWIDSVFGRRRRLNDVRFGDKEKQAEAVRQGINAQIQGTASDIAQIGFMRTYDYFKENNMKSKIIFSVHDEIVGYAHETEADIVQEMVPKLMTQKTDEYLPMSLIKVPLESEFEYFKNRWGD